jgi:hypothetical protein
MRRRKRVEAAQDDSRHMARMMFIETAPLAWGRDQAFKFYSLDQLVKQIAKISAADLTATAPARSRAFTASPMRADHLTRGFWRKYSASRGDCRHSALPRHSK